MAAIHSQCDQCGSRVGVRQVLEATRWRHLCQTHAVQSANQQRLRQQVRK